MIAEVTPHPGPSGKRTPWVGEARLSLYKDRLVATGPYGQQVALPLDGDLAIAGLVFARTNTLDQYGGVFNETILFISRDRRVLCTVPGTGWNHEELAALAKAAGLTYNDETFISTLEQDRAYSRVPSVVDVRESSRTFRGMGLAFGLGIPFIIAVLLVLLLH